MKRWMLSFFLFAFAVSSEAANVTREREDITYGVTVTSGTMTLTRTTYARNASPSAKDSHWVEWTVVWEADTDGNVTVTLDGSIAGMLVGARTKPDSNAPSDNYDITIEKGGDDILNGALLNRDTANSESVFVFADSNGNTGFPLLIGSVDLNIRSAGSENEGIITLYTLE